MSIGTAIGSKKRSNGVKGFHRDSENRIGLLW